MKIELDQQLYNILTFANHRESEVNKSEVLAGLKTLGERLKWVREYRGLSQEQLAITSITSQSLVASLELDKREPRDSNLAKLSMRLSVDFTWLKSGIGTPFKKDILQDSHTLSLLKISDIKKRIELAQLLHKQGLKELFEFAKIDDEMPEMSDIFNDIAGTPKDDALHTISIALAIRFEWLKYGEGSPFIGDSRTKHDLSAYIGDLPLPEGDMQTIFDIVRLSAIYLYTKNKVGKPPEKHIFKEGALADIESYLPRLDETEMSNSEYLDL
ncbi:helix-turn-helix domain-containing protein [Vibrio parahaemolyticus]|uniref:helix-turn-helix domain-containing protein n=1 Tax=Vibrio parahaemolyticus TaxID=670 RepID=UPI00215BADF1|nr:helix-turn-helix transcriptional regulator [Vibrio parahaemolyticus]EHR5320632.1 helix-turn-helix transcriptional regulator [Vibrio parahaemolyticus]MCR9856723.1 helix-turn-helix domain-containing protein [Vibrio parahaemolyticus]MDF4659725.1 helix-turn-helix transcriptional regulator [Vibrio parahaemolyticus]